MPGAAPFGVECFYTIRFSRVLGNFIGAQCESDDLIDEFELIECANNLGGRGINLGRRRWDANSVRQLLRRQLRSQHRTLEARQHRADLKHLASVFGDPDRLLVSVVFSVDNIHLESVERAGRYRNALNARNL